ncbi:RHS repeat-associated core domain-containing protein [Phocaeicola coprocola]|uniref:RHS repeat-associated core domain-containing protein n=1 Tax=Phocaeicola coprocola TaxID=310298 RepID=UPI0039F4975D
MLLDVYGEVKECHGDRTLVPFRYQGQYEDEETGLYYNRFRYYPPQMGMYISSDPIGLAGNNPTLYGYVHDPNIWLDLLGLDELVYQLLNEQDEVVYYGITSRTAEKRFAEHLANLEKRGKIARIEILAENLTHDEARSIEGALIRRRITQRLTNEQIRKLSVEEQLKEAGLINKNRGRDPNRWISATPLSTLEEKIYKTPKKICR